MAGTAPMAKKTVTHQQLYGPKRCLRQQLQRRPLPQLRRDLQFSDNYDEMSSSTMRRDNCIFQHSQSATALPPSSIYSSYTTLPATGKVDRHPTMANDGPSLWWVNHVEGCCCPYEMQKRTAQQQCTCGTASYQQFEQPQTQYPQHLATPLPPTVSHSRPKVISNGCYIGYDHSTHFTDEEDSAFPGLPDRELNLLHHNVPALRRTGVDTAGMRQYFYPDGGWGWIICGLSFLAHLLTTGLQLSYGLLMIYIIQHLHHSSLGTELLGALSWSVSMLASPFVVALCRKKSTRLLAVIGGLVLPLGILFTSFATELEQIIFSYGFVFGIGVSMVRDSSAIMLGNYFKRRRNFVEMVAMSGEGVGIALFSVLLKEGVGKAGWRLGLQIVAAFLAVSFFMALLYRPASLYHPQRRAIQHLKNQRKKMREDKLPTNDSAQRSGKFFLIDLSTLKSANVRILVMTSGVAAFGIYAPMFTISLNAEKEESDIQDVVLLQAFLGISTALGVVLASILVRRPFHIRRFVVTSQVVSQIFISTIAIAILFLSFVMGYQGLCILSWIYGMGFGGFRYSLKILALERVKLKQFSKAWGLMRGIESVPVLISVPLTTFLNDYSLKYGRAGYYICSAAAAIASIIIFFINHSNVQQNATNSQSYSNRRYENGLIASLLAPPAPPIKANFRHSPFFNCTEPTCEYTTPDLLNRSCMSLNNADTSEYRRSSSPYCCRLQFQCFCNKPFGETTRHIFDRHNQRRRTIDSDTRHLTPATVQYVYGQGSVGARQGKQLRRSLSFLQNPDCCDAQWTCNCPKGNAFHWTHPTQSFQLRQPILCSPAYYLQNCRSRSVPEGLSSASHQCICKAPFTPNRVGIDCHSMRQHLCSADFRHESSQYDTIMRQNSSMHRNYRLQRAEPTTSTKPMHYVEQMTTSV